MAKKKKLTIKRPGDLTRKAKAAGMTVNQYARHVLREGSRASELTKKQARYYLNVLKPASRKRKKS